jgi:hypothetical protein
MFDGKPEVLLDAIQMRKVLMVGQMNRPLATRLRGKFAGSPTSGFSTSGCGTVIGSQSPSEAPLSGFLDGIPMPAEQPACQVVVDPVLVSARLSDLHGSLDQALFREANEHGYRARLDVTPAHPTTSAGTFHWHAAVFALRTALIEREWIKKDTQNCPFILSPDKAVAILVMTGDADTGVVEGFPTNQAQKGVVLKQAVSANYELFERAMISKLERASNGTQMWVLLYQNSNARRLSVGLSELSLAPFTLTVNTMLALTHL